MSLEKFNILSIIALIIMITACERHKDTEFVSIVMQIPQFELEGGEFMSYQKGEIDEWEEPGYKAFSDSIELLAVDYGEEVETDKVGAYYRYYIAENAAAIRSTARRIIAITNNDVSDNDLSGIYYSDLFGVEIEMSVVKEHEKGYYKCEEVLGYPGAEMPGNFVDLGLGDLVLVSGEGDFGNYAEYSGSYTGNTLVWSVILLDEPNNGVEIDVFWKRKK